jgi:hypothetical protein
MKYILFLILFIGCHRGKNTDLLTVHNEYTCIKSHCENYVEYNIILKIPEVKIRDVCDLQSVTYFTLDSNWHKIYVQIK